MPQHLKVTFKKLKLPNKTKYCDKEETKLRIIPQRSHSVKTA